MIQRGFEELREVPALPEEQGDVEAVGEVVAGEIPTVLDVANARPGIGNPGRFWEQVCGVCKVGQDTIADPFAAISAIPAGTSTIRDMTDIRFEVPDFIPELCTGCSQCWVQCPDAAIPGVVNSVEQILDTAIAAAANGRPLDRMKQVSKNLAVESRKVLKGVPFTTFGNVVSDAYKNLVEKLNWDAERRRALDEEFAAVYSVLAEFPLAKTVPFFDVPERSEKGSGGLLSITVSPDACTPSARTRRSSTGCAGTGRSGSASPTRPTSTSTSPTSRRASVSSRPCSSRRESTARWSGATGPAWGAARRPPST